ncbi:hypothetical protein OY671_010243, partial [Metschnikowia pulcherrima]
RQRVLESVAARRFPARQAALEHRRQDLLALVGPKVAQEEHAAGGKLRLGAAGGRVQQAAS